jgi:hypothetical protein
VVWDEPRQVLWALGFDELRKYTLKDWQTAKPTLELQKSYPLPGERWARPAAGAGLRRRPVEPALVTTEKHVWVFDRDTEKFRRHLVIGDLAKVKAVDIHPTSGRIVYSLWAQKFFLASPNVEITTKGNTIYKIRWLVEEAPPQEKKAE